MKYYKVNNQFFEVAEPAPIEEPEEAAHEWPAGEIPEAEYTKGVGSAVSSNSGGSTGSVSAAPLAFSSLVGMTSKSPGSVTKTVNTTLWDAGGWGDKPGSILLWQANTASVVAMLGWVALSQSGSPDWKKVAHGLYIANGQLSVYEFGVEKAKGSHIKGDMLTVSLVGSSVIYAVNSKLLYTSTKHALEPLVPGVLVRSANVEVSNLKFA